MRRQVLAPPVPVSIDGFAGEEWFNPVTVRREQIRLALDSAEPPQRPLDREELAEAHEADPTPRHLLDPAKGWFRTLERHASLFLSHHVFPRIPGIQIPYTLQLDRNLLVSEADVALRGLDPRLDGAKVLFVSDFHAGPFLSPRALDRTLQRLAGLDPDLILIGGDFASTNVAEFERCAPALRQLQAPLGVFGVMGNHDYYTEDAARLWRVIEQQGVRMLRNDALRVERDGASLVVAGLDDYLMGTPDMAATARAIRRARGDSGAPTVMLSHNPDALFEASAADVDLVLSGHTHGGQVRVPKLPVLVRMSRFRLDQGRYQSGATQLIVSRGMGVSGIPLRLYCPPEAMLVTLRTSAP